jgi:hypothetical protein
MFRKLKNCFTTMIILPRKKVPEAKKRDAKAQKIHPAQHKFLIFFPDPQA